MFLSSWGWFAYWCAGNQIFVRDDEVRDAFGFSLLPVYFLLEHA